MIIRTRVAPSPTGFPHIGTAYQALFNYAFAKKYKGKFILRIEDTDVKRTVPGAEKMIDKALHWLDLNPDENPKLGGPYGPYKQSKRLHLYGKYAQVLIRDGFAYYCFCSESRLKKLRERQQKNGKPSMYDRKCRSLSSKEAERRVKNGENYVIRMKIPDNEKIVVSDLIRGKVVFDSSILDDQVLLKSDGFPTYHLAVVVDDHLMKISHVVRGEEWLSSAPKHILLYRYFGWKAPKFVHTALLRNSDKTKLSKRHGHTSIFWYKNQGYLPEALTNFLALLGWSHPEEKEVFCLDEFIEHFRFEDLSSAGPIFNLEKLDWLNGVYIRKKSRKELVRLIEPFAPKGFNISLINKTIPLVQERITKLSDYSDLVDFLVKEIKYPAKLLIQKGKTKKETRKMLLMINDQLSMIKEKDWQHNQFEKICRNLVSQADWKPRDFFMTIRVAVTGKTITPPLFESMELLGKKKTLQRLQKAIKKLS